MSTQFRYVALRRIVRNGVVSLPGEYVEYDEFPAAPIRLGYVAPVVVSEATSAARKKAPSKSEVASATSALGDDT